MTTDLMPEVPEHLYGLATLTADDTLAKAINRLAQAIEQNTLAMLDQRVGTQAPVVVPAQPLAALPPVQTVANKPSCPKHGPDKVSPSTKFTGFFCTAKDEAGPRGYCSWQART